MPILEPDKEGLAWQRLIRIGAKTWGQMVREQGEDPIAQLEEIQRFNAELDERGIVLDCDPRKTNSSGQAQAGGGAPSDADAEDDSVDITADVTGEPDAAPGDGNADDEQENEDTGAGEA